MQVWKNYCECLQDKSKDEKKTDGGERNELALTGEEFLRIPCFAISPLRHQFLRCIPSKRGAGSHKGDVDFEAFMRLMAVTNGESRAADKLKFAFQMYDMDGDGKIATDDLVMYLEAVTDFDEDTKQQQEEYKEFIKKAAKTTFEELGRDDYLRIEDFAKTLLHSDFGHKYQVRKDVVVVVCCSSYFCATLFFGISFSLFLAIFFLYSHSFFTLILHTHSSHSFFTLVLHTRSSHSFFTLYTL